MVFFATRGWIGPSYTALSDLEEGALVKLKESGSPVEFYVAKHDYESGLNGAGRTLLVRKDCYDDRHWHSSNVNAYASSTIDSWLNNTYKNMLDTDIRESIGTTKIRYTPGNGNIVVGTLERAIFLLSITELGQSHTYTNVEGSALPIASTLKTVNYNGRRDYQWTRSPNTNNAYGAWGLDPNGEISDGSGCTNLFGSRPCFTLPSTTLANADGLIE